MLHATHHTVFLNTLEIMDALDIGNDTNISVGEVFALYETSDKTSAPDVLQGLRPNHIPKRVIAPTSRSIEILWSAETVFLKT